MNHTESQERQIADYLLSGRSLTAAQALVKFDCFRLSGRIFRLRYRDGLNIETEMITTKSGKRIAKYSIPKS